MTTISDFASSAGGSIATDLVPTAAEYIGQLAEGNNLLYGLVKYTFNTVDLSAVQKGYKLTVSGFTNSENNGTNQRIHAVDNDNNTITIKTVDRLDDSKDETGITGSGSVLDSGASRKAPSGPKILQGILDGEFLPADVFNWLIYEQNLNIAEALLRGGHARVDSNIITSSTFADLDSALENFGYFHFDPGVSWTTVGNDGAYEDVGLTVNATSNNDSQTLLLLTGNIPNGTDGAFDPRIKANGVVTNTFKTAPYSAVETFAQLTNAFGFAALLDNGGATTYTAEAKRRTNNEINDLRLHVIDVPDSDESDVALIRETAALTETNNSTTSFVDITGASVTATFTHSNALILFGNSIKENGEGTTTGMTRSYRLLRDATTMFDLDTGGGGSAMYKGGHDEQARLISVTGAHTLKMQGRRSGGSGTLQFAASNNGYFTVIELPDTWDGDTLARESVDVDDTFTNTSNVWTTMGTITDAACNGHPMLLGVSGNFYSSGNGIDVEYRVLVDDVAAEDVFETRCDNGDSSRYPSLFFLLDDLAAGTHTFKIQVRHNGGVGHYFYDSQFFAAEFPKVTAPSVTPVALTLTSTTGKKVQLQHRGTVTATENSTLTLRATADGVAVGNEEAYNLTADTAVKIDFLTVATGAAAGSDVDYKIQAKIDAGRASAPPADFIAQELPGT